MQDPAEKEKELKQQRKAEARPKKVTRWGMVSKVVDMHHRLHCTRREGHGEWSDKWINGLVQCTVLGTRGMVSGVISG